MKRLELRSKVVLLALLEAWLLLGYLTDARELGRKNGRAPTQAVVGAQVLGADGASMTQVAAAQRYGLTGKRTRLCVMDDAIDVSHPTFGNCSVSSPLPKTGCQVFYSYDAYTASSSQPQTQKPLPDVFHGTHVAGIAVGRFPFKLRNPNGTALAFQRGVAYQARLGAFKIGDNQRGSQNSLVTAAISKAWAASTEAKCDVINMSWGYESVTPDQTDIEGLAPVLSQGIIPVAAAGNRGGENGAEQLFGIMTPASISEVLAVAAVNNTAVPGTSLQFNRVLQTEDENTTTLMALSRIDTSGTVGSALQLPASLALVRTSPYNPGASVGGCLPLVTITRNPPTYSIKNWGIVLQILPDCYWKVETSARLWDSLLAIKPRLILMVLPDDEFAFSSRSLNLRNGQVPVFIMRSRDGQALAKYLSEFPVRAIQLRSILGSEMVPLPSDWAGQPTLWSSMGPTVDLRLKPDIAAPGNLMYSSMPNDRYGMLQGTSMASPYTAGVVALWKQRQLDLGITEPPGGWVTAATRALKNTAKPMPYRGSPVLVYPPVKVGAGLIQAMSAAFTDVSITPSELLLRTDAASQRLTLTLTNTGPVALTYRTAHLPAVGVSPIKAWYKQVYDVISPKALVVVSPSKVTVPAGGNTTVQVTITLQSDLRREDLIVSGYIQFIPDPFDSQGRPPHENVRNLTKPALVTPMSPIILSVPYQGSSKDWSSFGLAKSMALFAEPLPELNMLAAMMLQDRPAAYICDFSQDADICMYRMGPLAVTAGEKVTIAAAFVRPVAWVDIEVWCIPTAQFNCSVDDDSVITGRTIDDIKQPLVNRTISDRGGGDRDNTADNGDSIEISILAQQASEAVFMGTSYLGACPTSLPLTVSQITNTCQENFRGEWFPNGDYTKEAVYPMAGSRFLYKLRISPSLAAADAAGGRRQSSSYVVDMPNAVHYQ